ncbi:MAG: hypothetical protein ABUT20_01580 [Bacteroidota bacterium]
MLLLNFRSAQADSSTFGNPIAIGSIEQLKKVTIATRIYRIGE